MALFQWAKNENKLQRAIAKSLTGNEEEIKQLYIELGGLVIFDNSQIENTMSDSEDVSIININDTSVSHETDVSLQPKKRGRPSKKVL